MIHSEPDQPPRDTLEKGLRFGCFLSLLYYKK